MRQKHVISALYIVPDTAFQSRLERINRRIIPGNDSAIRLYARKGFRPGKLLRGYYPDGTDARRMSFRTSCGRPE